MVSFAVEVPGQRTCRLLLPQLPVLPAGASVSLLAGAGSDSSLRGAPKALTKMALRRATVDGLSTSLTIKKPFSLSCFRCALSMRGKQLCQGTRCVASGGALPVTVHTPGSRRTERECTRGAAASAAAPSAAACENRSRSVIPGQVSRKIATHSMLPRVQIAPPAPVDKDGPKLRNKRESAIGRAARAASISRCCRQGLAADGA